MNIGYKIDTEKVRKQNMIDLLKDQPLQTLQIAYLYAKNYCEYGEDVTRTWNTAVENASAIDNAYRKGYNDAMQIKSGYWIPIPYELEYQTDAKCSVCFKEIVNGINYKYCPNCGIKMIKEVGECLK